MNKVFISYSHDSQNHMDRVLDASNRLREDGIDCNIDQYVISPDEGWPRWMVNQIEEADFVLVVCTETYKNRFMGKEKQGKGLGGKWEGAILTQKLYDNEANNTKFIPVVFSPHDLTHIPLVLHGTTYYELHKEQGYKTLYRHLTNQPKVPKPELGKRKSMPPSNRMQYPPKFTDDDNKQNFTVYCSRCGEIQGERSTCISFDGYHNFKTYKDQVYCSYCGIAAGKSSTCISFDRYHNFKSYTGKVNCSRCGIAAGKRSTCTSFDRYHNFNG